MSESAQRVAVFGAGYVGLVTGACFAELGHRVTVRDILSDRIEALRRGEVPIYEPGLEELLARNAERLTFTTEVAEAMEAADVVYVAVGTPPTYSGDADLSAVWTVIDELPAVERRIVVAMKSTVPVGTGGKVRHRLDARGLAHVGYVSNPEFTAEGTAVKDFMEPDRIVIGAFDEAAGDVVAALHAGIDAPIVRSDVASAEMIKLAANAALMTRISFINEIANVCEATGADVVKVAEGIGLDRRIGRSFLRAGIGFGGSCFPKDSLALKQLAANSGYHFQVLNAVIEVNELQKRRVIGKLVAVGGRPLLSWQLGRLSRAGVSRVIVSCLGGQEETFLEGLHGVGPDIVCAGEPERLGRGGGIRFAAGFRRESGDVLAMNGDELVAVDFEALLERHRSTGAAATVTVAQPASQFGRVELTDDDVVTGFEEAGTVPYWVNCGIYALSEEALARFPEKGDHESTAFPELATEGRLRAFRHTGIWLTVNTPKELRRADEYVAEHPEWLG